MVSAWVLVALATLVAMATLGATAALVSQVRADAPVLLRRPYDGAFTLNQGMDHNRSSGANVPTFSPRKVPETLAAKRSSLRRSG